MCVSTPQSLGPTFFSVIHERNAAHTHREKKENEWTNAGDRLFVVVVVFCAPMALSTCWRLSSREQLPATTAQTAKKRLSFLLVFTQRRWGAAAADASHAAKIKRNKKKKKIPFHFLFLGLSLLPFFPFTKKATRDGRAAPITGKEPSLREKSDDQQKC